MKINEWTPLHTRFISHRIGDGTVNVHGYPVWDNKNIIEFLELANLLNFKLWKPVNSSGTYKIVITKYAFEKFGKIFNKDAKMLIQNPIYLLDTIKKLPEEHRLQTILALITDDGSCRSWLLVVFEDKNKEVVNKVYNIWDSLFPSTAKIKSHKTKHGTNVYHIYSNKKGIEQLYYKIKEAEEKYGPLANLWWKQKDLEKRYSKIISSRAKTLNETKRNRNLWEMKILDYMKKNKKLRIFAVMKILGLNYYRTNRILYRMVKEGKLFLNYASSRSFYSLKPDKSIENRDNIILNYVKENGSIGNKEARMLLDRGMDRTYKILKDMVNRGLLKQKEKFMKCRYLLA